MTESLANAASRAGQDAALCPLIGQMLLRTTSLSENDLAEALSRQEECPEKKIGQVLIEMEHVRELDVCRALAEQWHFAYMEKIPSDAVKGELFQNLPMEFLRKHALLPFHHPSGKIAIAVGDPLDTMAIDSVVNSLGGQCHKVLVPQSAIESGLSEHFYDAGDDSETSGLESDERLSDVNAGAHTEDLLDLSKEAPIVKLVNAFLFQASQSRASDIHIEPYESDAKVRFRIDGVLYTQTQFPKRYYAAVVSRLKIMAQLNIAERRLPQDGRSRIKIGNRELDTRVSTIPTAWGERVVLRLLDESGAQYGLEQLGFERETEDRFRRLIYRSHGILLLTGPTGSGKTTTLYGAMSELNSDNRNIMTVEDPIEYRLAGVSQTQVMPKIGLTFAACLRHILRQDPDIIMVGEIRDLETARIAIQAALTGHLVLSTLHTNDAASAATRLIDMGVEPYLVCSSLLGVMAQRLVRQTCPSCHGETGTSHSQESLGRGVTRMGQNLDPARSGGECPNCNGTGYRGRTGIFELLVLNDDLRELVLNDARAHHLKEAALKNGMHTLREDGLIKVSKGMTTTEEVLRVTQEDSDADR